MLLFDIIRDWFVQYIWGGLLSDGETIYYAHIGQFTDNDNNYFTADTVNTYLHLPFFNDEAMNLLPYYSIGDWLSTTSTIIVMILLCIVFGLMVRWLFRLTAGLLRGN